jgi:HD-GYP domain-containing protein (c-di-GMP phosphodiesterase class II)
LLHDIGKIGIPARVLDKPGQLDEEERDMMRQHPEIGARILAPIKAYADVIPLVLYHHERFDGTGYPAGLKGENIPFFARLLTVPDVFDAIHSDRPYRPGWPAAKAVDVITKASGLHFDPDLVEAFERVMATQLEKESRDEPVLVTPAAKA